ncbi:MAG TPA: hypothetical protein EYP71_01315 [Dehalococcoidia bacterium]|nr:hypothetical protein [Dehalococcoidia bacterium]
MKQVFKVILPVLLAAAMLVATMPATALAQDGPGPPRRSALIARAAEILNIDQQELEDAITQARQELREEALNSRLQELVEEGTLTQQQVNEYQAWLEARPDIPKVPRGQLKEAMEKGIITQEQIDQFKAWLEARPDIPRIWPTFTERLIEQGIITQQQADEYKAWLESRPDIPRVPLWQLKRLLDEGEITQEQLDQFKAWLEARPEMPEVRPELLKERTEKIQQRRDVLAARVAEILGINKQELEDAFKQAQTALREEALDARLRELVNEGLWTQQQADEYKAWIKARPDVPPLRPVPPFRQPGFPRW